MPTPVRHRIMLVLASLTLLGGCANGDFQEVRPSLVRDGTHDWLALDAIAGKHAFPSHYPLTDDERAMRDLGYPLIEQPYNRHKWYSIAEEYGTFGSDHRAIFDRAAYSNHLMGDRYRSPSARYARLSDDIHNDTVRLPAFFEAATRVLEIDRKRRQSMAFIHDLSPFERDHALRRINENAAIVALARDMLARRLVSYRFALERLVVITPSQQAVECERALNRLAASIARYRHPVPTWHREQSLASAR